MNKTLGYYIKPFAIHIKHFWVMWILTIMRGGCLKLLCDYAHKISQRIPSVNNLYCNLAKIRRFVFIFQGQYEKQTTFVHLVLTHYRAISLFI
jgi:uncharacterized membrane protein